jgi:hypothetical protein
MSISGIRSSIAIAAGRLGRRRGMTWILKHYPSGFVAARQQVRE